MDKGKILVVEDRKELAKLLRSGFQQAGYRTVASGDGAEAVKVARREHPDLVVLDISLPSMDGFDVCRELRQESGVPIVFLTGRAKEVDQLLGLRLGADDYVTKPFSMDILLARVQAALRRSKPHGAGNSRPEGLRFGELDIDLERHEVRVQGRGAALTDKEFRLLSVLLDGAGKVVTRAQLLERVWGYLPDMDVDTRTLDQLVSRLRRKLGPERGRLTTVPAYGYRFVIS